MDSRGMELVELFEKAKKAADIVAASSDDEYPKDADVQRCLDVLSALRSLPVSLPILVSTQVGKRLRMLKKHPQARIRTAASEIIEDWKKLVPIETAGSNGSKSSGPEDKKAKNIKTEDKQLRPLKVEDKQVRPVKTDDKIDKREKEEHVKVERKPKEESYAISHKKAPSASTSNGPPKLSAMIKCNDAIRDKFREILHEALAKVTTEAQGEDLARVKVCDPVRVAVSVETVMFEKLGKSNGAEKLKYRSIMFNLRDSNNPDLRRRVLLGEIKPEKLIVLTPEEMASDKRKQENQQIKEKALFECERGQRKSASTDQFKCGKCGKRECTYYQMQTRSADEPMTTFVSCVNCNNRWKFC